MPHTLPIILNDAERRALLSQPNPRYISGQRNYCLLRILFNCGLRLSEVTNLRWDDIDFLSEVLMVRKEKGDKDRTLYFKDNNWRGEDDKELLSNWKKGQLKHLGYLPEHVFTTISNNHMGDKLSNKYVQSFIVRYAKKASINKKIGPHTLRHTFAIDLYRKTKDIVVVQRTLGHVHISSTMFYVHLVKCDVEKALTGTS